MKAKNYKNIDKTKWTSNKTKTKRLLETLAVLLYINFMIISIFVIAGFNFILMIYLNNIGRIVFLIYFVFICFDNKTRFAALNGNGWLFFRKNFMANHLKDYFPIEIVKTAELEPTRNYVIASFPHGVVCSAVSINMAYNIGNWLQLYPGIRPKLATMGIYFYIPIFREILRLWGFVSCAKDTLTYYLSKSNHPQHKDNKDGFTSNAVAILVGGIKEGLDSRPGHYIINLKKRKGFIKLAIKTGSAIVPTISFGEIDIIEPVDNSSSSPVKNQELAFTRRLLQYSLGYLPKRKRVVLVVGAPIEVENISKPDDKYVDDIHQTVIDRLYDMFEKFKHQYIENADEVKLVIK